MKDSKLYSVLVSILRPLVRTLYRLKVQGIENIPNDGAVIICPNHTSNMDPILLAVALPRQVYFMAKAELFKFRLFGGILRKVGAFPVNRGKGDNLALDTAESILKNGKQLGIFIEGTRSKTGEFLRPKTGCALIAYRVGVPVVPVCIRGKHGHKLRLFRRNVISIGEAITTTDLGINDGSGKELRAASRFIMERIKALASQV